MSFDSLAWAAKQNPGNLAAKMVLLALANYADEHGCAYPSLAAIAEFGAMNRKTVIAALDRLEGLGMIADTGDKKGQSAQIKIYKLSLVTVPKTEPSQKGDSPEKSPRQSQKRDTGTVRTPSVAKATSGRARDPKAKFVLPDWVPVEEWQGWLTMRAACRHPASDRAKQLAVAKLAKLQAEGFDPGQVLDQSTLKSWTDLWPIKDAGGRAQSPPSPSSDLQGLLNVDKYKGLQPLRATG